MMTDISSETASTAATSAENTSQTVDTSTVTNHTADTQNNAIEPQNINKMAAPGTPGSAQAQAKAPAGTTAVQQADGTVAYVPNFKYKAAGQEKEIDPFFHALIKDADSEKKVKDIFTKLDAFDFVKGKSENLQKEFGSLYNDYQDISTTVDKFNKAVQAKDLNSAFRLANISPQDVLQWTRSYLQTMEMKEQMTPQQRQAYEQAEQAKYQQSELEERVQSLQSQYENQAVLARTMQLDMSLSRPEVSKFAQAWDQSSGQEGSFREFVVEEARRVYYEQGVDLSPEQAVARVMQRFGKFLNVGETTTAQSPQAIIQTQSQKPVIPHVAGKASSPIKKVVKSLDDIKALAKSM